MSEGLDFADVNGRAVIITGLPYPPRMDPRVSHCSNSQRLLCGCMEFILMCYFFMCPDYSEDAVLRRESEAIIFEA